MAMHNPKGRANYEPNSWSGAQAGPRETPDGFQSFAADESGPKLRIRAESFADHYSQARQFYISQTPVEQDHIKSALVFELSKVQRPDIRIRMVSHLLNIDGGLAKKVADELRLQEMPNAATAAKPTRQDLPKSDALSILLNAPDTLKGRKLGVLLTDGADAKLLDTLKQAAKKHGAVVEIIAQMIGGVKTSDDGWIEADHKIDGGPSVLFDAVVLLMTKAGAGLLAREPAARDFVADAHTHMKFIGYCAEAIPLLQKAGIAEELDAGCVALDNATAVNNFIKKCAALRFWDRATA